MYYISLRISKIKPFNLERALAGDPIQCRNSDIKILEWTYFKDSEEIFACLKLTFGEKGVFRYTKNGYLYPSEIVENEIDLVMAEPQEIKKEKKKYYMAIKKHEGNQGFFTTNLYSTKKEVEDFLPRGDFCKKLYKIIEVEI